MNIQGSSWIRLIVRLALAGMVSACAPTPAVTSPVSTVTPPTHTIAVVATNTSILRTVTPKPTEVSPVVSGPEVEFQDVKFSVPAKLESKVQAQAAPPTNILGEAYPPSTLFTFVGYQSQNASLKPQIQIYAVHALGPSAMQAAQALKDLLADRPTSLPGEIPILPIVPAGQLIDAQIKYLPFANGSGLRVLTQFAQGSWPINNEGLAYIFQGLTRDGQYYITASLPVKASFLPDHVDDPSKVPAIDGIAYPEFNSANFDSEYASYQRAILHKLNTTSEEEYEPSLTTLDELIQSLQIKSVVETGASVTDPCINGLPTRLHVGGFAYVNADPPLPNNLRREAGTSNPLIGTIQPGTAMKVLEGPQCADGWVWWKVRTFEPEQVGWTAEGDQKNYWLIPCEARSKCAP